MSPSMRRVWIEMGDPGRLINLNFLSPSMRRVWIEIDISEDDLTINPSPSMRRVWIEISMEESAIQEGFTVTLHAEGVD